MYFKYKIILLIKTTYFQDKLSSDEVARVQRCRTTLKRIILSPILTAINSTNTVCKWKEEEIFLKYPTIYRCGAS